LCQAKKYFIRKNFLINFSYVNKKVPKEILYDARFLTHAPSDQQRDETHGKALCP
jgi:hypothetical protein